MIEVVRVLRRLSFVAAVVCLAAFGNMPWTFSFEVRGDSGALIANELALDPAVVFFARGETKRHVFDFVIGNDPASRAFPPGTYTVRGAYGGHWKTHPPLVIAP